MVPIGEKNTQLAVKYCLEHPRWRVSLQTHKLMGIPMTTHVKPVKLEVSKTTAGSVNPAADKRTTRIGRTYRFELAHHSPNVPDGHRCKNLHGHNYRVEIVVSGKLDDRGFVLDFAEIDAEIAPLIKKVDHCLLNNVEGLENPTAEDYRCLVFATDQRLRKRQNLSER